MLLFIPATLKLYREVWRADKSDQMWQEISCPHLSISIISHLHVKSKFTIIYKAVLPVEENTQLLPFARAVSNTITCICFHHFLFRPADTSRSSYQSSNPIGQYIIHIYLHISAVALTTS